MLCGVLYELDIRGQLKVGQGAHTVVHFQGVGRLLSQVEVREGEGSFNLALIELEAGPVLGGIIDDAATPSIGDKVEAYDLKIDAETALRQASARFKERFSYIERTVRRQGGQLSEMSLVELDRLWDEAKRGE